MAVAYAIEGNDRPRSHEDKGARGSPAKPCCRCLPGDLGPMWCILPEGHYGDCEGVSAKEMPMPFEGLDPRRKPRWGR
jgi:hypothetical protein